MFKHILIPLDGSELAEKALDAGIGLARETGAKVTFFTAVPEFQPPGEADFMAKRVISLEKFHENCHEAAEGILAPAAKRARESGVEADTDYAENDFPYRAIIAAAKGHGCDLILMSSHGRGGISAFLHGSEARAVLSHSTIPTLVYR